MDFFAGVSFGREDCFGADVLPAVRPAIRLLETAGVVLEDGCAAAALDCEELVFVLIFWVLCPAPRVLVCCLADRVGPGLFEACSAVFEGILALKIFDFSTAALLFFCWVAGDPAGNIFEVINCRC